jgi:hypothetical protein
MCRTPIGGYDLERRLPEEADTGVCGYMMMGVYSQFPVL